MLSYLVNHGGKRKLIEVSSKKDIMSACSKVFDITGGIRLEMFVDCFGEYVDVDNVDSLPDMCKLRISSSLSREETVGLSFSDR